jgi:hypothetical protein
MRPISRTNQLRNIPDRSILDLGPHRAQRRRKWLASSKNDSFGSLLKPSEAVSRTSDQDTSVLECATPRESPERGSVAPESRSSTSFWGTARVQECSILNGREFKASHAQQFVPGRHQKWECWQNNSRADFPMALHVRRRAASPRLYGGMDVTSRAIPPAVESGCAPA